MLPFFRSRPGPRLPMGRLCSEPTASKPSSASSCELSLEEITLLLRVLDDLAHEGEEATDEPS
jgi:hypothetical protein